MNILVVYSLNDAGLRSSVVDHLHAFDRPGGNRPVYWNALLSPLPIGIRQMRFDLVVFHTTVLSVRWNRANFRRLLEKLDRLRTEGAVRVALPQDEFLNTDLLEEFFLRHSVDHVYSCAAPAQWPRIYPETLSAGPTFHQVMTGYLSEQTVTRVTALVSQSTERPIDVSYRAWRAAPWIGALGELKVEVGLRAQQLAPAHGLLADISLDPLDTLMGDDWFRFLARSRWTVGVEGGSTILDRDGSLRRRCEDYVGTHPDASREEVAAHCLRGQEGTLNLRALSPRHLEACLTRTGQLLVEGEYNGVLKPDRHYLPIREDLGNLDDVLEAARDETVRAEQTERAFADVIDSGRYTYSSLARFILSTALNDDAVANWESPGPRPSRAAEWVTVQDQLVRRWVPIRAWGRDVLRSWRGRLGPP